MNLKFPAFFVSLALLATGCINTKFNESNPATLSLKSKELSQKGNGNGALKLDGLFYETVQGRVVLPAELTSNAGEVGASKSFTGQSTMPDGRVVKVSVGFDGNSFSLKLGAEPSTDIVNR